MPLKHVIVVLLILSGWGLAAGQWWTVPREAERLCLETHVGAWCPPTDVEVNSMIVDDGIPWEGEKAVRLSGHDRARNGWTGSKFGGVTFAFKRRTGRWETVGVNPWVSGAEMDAQSRLRYHLLETDHFAREDQDEILAEMQAMDACTAQLKAQGRRSFTDPRHP